MDISSLVATVQAAHRVGASQGEREAEVQLFKHLLSSTIITAVDVGLQLTAEGSPVEAQLLGYAVLHHVVGVRWHELSSDQQRALGDAAYNLLTVCSTMQKASPYVIRSKAASLAALVLKKSDPDALHSTLAFLVERAGDRAIGQTVICLVFRYLGEEIMQNTEPSFAGDRLRRMVTAFTSSLVSILTFLERTVESNYVRRSDRDSVQAVEAALSAAFEYADWAPMASFLESGLIRACCVLLQSSLNAVADLKGTGTGTDNDSALALEACKILSRLASRRQTAEEAVEPFAAAMFEINEALMSVAQRLLAPSAQPMTSLDYQGDRDEFGQCVCEALATLGTGHLSQAAPDPGRRLAYLHVMLAFARHPYLLLADKALGLWAKLLHDFAASSTQTTEGSVDADASKSSFPPEAVLELMQLAAEHLQLRNPHLPQAEENYPPYFIEFEDYKEFMIGYRLKLSNIVKSAAAVLPVQAIQAAQSRLGEAAAAVSSVLGSSSGTPATTPAISTSATKQPLEEARVLLESAVIFTESAVRAVWDVVQPRPELELMSMVANACESMLGTLLALTPNDPGLVSIQARGLEAFSRLLTVRQALVPPIIDRLFALLTQSLPMEQGEHIAPPPSPPPGWREGLQARSAVAMVFLEYAKAAPEAFVPHLQTIATRLVALWDAGLIRPGERNAVTEAILAAMSLAKASMADDQQRSLMEWALAPVRVVWCDPAWQACVASPSAFVARFIPPTQSSFPPWKSAGPQRWELYHQVHMVERAVRRTLPLASGSASSSMSSNSNSNSNAVLAEHMVAWGVPSLLKIMSCVNALYTPSGREAMTAASAVAALDMAPQERALYLRRRSAPSAGGGGGGMSAFGGRELGGAEANNKEEGGEYASVGSESVPALRAWLRHLREFTCHTLGLLPTHVPDVLYLGKDLPTLIPPALLDAAESLSHTHIRLVLRHVALPLIKHPPADRVIVWGVPLLRVLAPHMQTRLSTAWNRLKGSNSSVLGQQGRYYGFLASLGKATEEEDEEVVEEGTLRELTQEYGEVLKEVAARGMSPPSLSSEQDKDKEDRKLLLQVLLEWEPACAAACATAAVEGITRWPDDAAAYRCTLFLKALVSLAPLDRQLYSYVGTEVLKAAITSLSSEVMATHQADALGLIRQILAMHIQDDGSGAHGVLRSLPGVTPQVESEFKAAFIGTGSEKEQRNAVKRLLVGSGGFAALADWRPPATVPLRIAAPPRAGRGGVMKEGAASDEQLQGDITRALFD